MFLSIATINTVGSSSGVSLAAIVYCNGYNQSIRKDEEILG